MADPTEQMIAAGMAALRLRYPYMSLNVARLITTDIVGAALKVSAWLEIDDAARTGNDVLLGRRDTGVQIVASWDDDPRDPARPWTTLDGSYYYHRDAFDVYRALDPLPPATGAADHG